MSSSCKKKCILNVIDKKINCERNMKQILFLITYFLFEKWIANGKTPLWYYINTQKIRTDDPKE